MRSITPVKNYMTTDGPRYQEAKDYIAYLEDSGITEEYISTTVTDVVDLGNGSFEVTTVEEFIIYYPDSEQYKTFSTVCEIQNSNGGFKVHKLISTTEI